MGIAAESPGNIKNQVGRSLNAIREAFLMKDLEGIADQTDLLVTLAIPYIDKKDEAKFDLPEFDEESATAKDYTKFYRRVREIQRDVLRLLATRNIYAWTSAEEGDIGDLSLRDDEGRVAAEAASGGGKL